MSTIRKQSIISSGIVYFGFALGLFNTYLFTRQGGFTEAQYGLTGTFISFATIMFSLANLGMPAYIGKFFPYYKAHLSSRNNDQFSWALLVSCIGFLLVLIAGIAFKKILVDKVFSNSPQLLQYYYWAFLFSFGFTLFSLLEGYAWQHRKAVLSNLMKEVIFRFLTTLLIVATTFGLIRSFNSFVVFYSFQYLALALVLVYYFLSRRELHFTLRISKVTRRFYGKVRVLASFVWSGSLLFNVAAVADIFIIAAIMPDGMTAVAPFLLAQNIASLIQAPQRAVVSAAVGPLSTAWKEKDYARINRIYHGSSINQLIFSCAMFCLIWLNFEDGIFTFHLQAKYLDAKWVFFFIGLSRIVDMGTGLNSQIIGASTFWRFEFVSGLILLSLTLPLNWLLTQKIGILGPAISNLFSFTVYNTIRYIFLWKKFQMQPFTWKTLLTLVLAAAAYFVCFWLFDAYRGFGWIVLRSLVFTGLFAAGMLGMRLTPDAAPVWMTVKKRLRLAR